MKKLLWASALVVSCLAVPPRAHAFFFCCRQFPYRVEAGANCYLRVNSLGPGPQCGPWYLYWPLEAHFQPPAPAAFPYWPPPPQSLPPTFRPPAPVGSCYPGAPGAPVARTPPPPGVRPVNYQAPAYWYGGGR